MTLKHQKDISPKKKTKDQFAVNIETKIFGRKIIDKFSIALKSNTKQQCRIVLSSLGSGGEQAWNLSTRTQLCDFSNSAQLLSFLVNKKVGPVNKSLLHRVLVKAVSKALKCLTPGKCWL